MLLGGAMGDDYAWLWFVGFFGLWAGLTVVAHLWIKSWVFAWGSAFGAMLVGLAAAGLLAALLFAEEKPTAQAGTSNAKPLAAPRLRDHRYSIKDGYVYAYESMVSNNERDQGALMSEMVSIQYLGYKGGKYQVRTLSQSGFYAVMDCDQPCEHIRTREFYRQGLEKKSYMKMAHGSVAEAIFTDAAMGKLDRFQAHGQYEWHNEENLMEREPVKGRTPEAGEAPLR